MRKETTQGRNLGGPAWGQVAGEEKAGTVTRRREVGVKGPGPLEVLLPSFVPITRVPHGLSTPQSPTGVTQTECLSIDRG